MTALRCGAAIVVLVTALCLTRCGSISPTSQPQGGDCSPTVTVGMNESTETTNGDAVARMTALRNVNRAGQDFVLSCW
jgi:hypothetical protein